MAAAQGCSPGGSEVITLEQVGPLGITSVEITRTRGYIESAESHGAIEATTMLRGLDADGDEIATVSLRSGIVSYSYDDAQWLDTPGRQIAAHLRPGAWDVTSRWPGFTPNAELRIPQDLESFIEVPAVARELASWGVHVTPVAGGKGTIIGGISGKPSYGAGAIYHGHPCSDRPDLFSADNLSNVGYGAQCAFDDADRPLPYEQLYCASSSLLRIAFPNYWGLDACAMSDGSNYCGEGTNDGTGRPIMCTYGPCFRGAAQDYRSCAGDCSVGWKSNGADFTCSGCSGNGCSSGNGSMPGAAGCSYKKCCYNASTGQSSPCN